MKEKSEERRAVREQRVELAQQEAESEMQFRKTLATTTEKARGLSGEGRKN